MPTLVTVNDRMQRGYTYTRTAGMGRGMAFTPAYSPAEMLHRGVFEGKYMRDCRGEFPASWFRHAREARGPRADAEGCNMFGIKSRLSLQEWRRRHWLTKDDPRGWFQWYCRYYSGRRLPDVDPHQISRWRQLVRHAAQVRLNCTHRGANGRCRDPYHCRPRQRQALLQWSHDCLI